MNKLPMNYPGINAYNGNIFPSTVHSRDNITFAFNYRYYFNKLLSVFKHTFPENWDKNYVLYSLYGWGFFAVVNTDKFGIIPQACGISGYNVMYQPTHCQIANPLLRGILNPKIGVECELVKLQYDYTPPIDIVATFADMRTLAMQTTDVNLLNSHLSYIFGAKNKAQAETFKKMCDDIYRGEPSTFLDSRMFNETSGKIELPFAFQNVAQNYIADKTLSALDKIDALFNTTIGIPNANLSKKERMIADEVNANNVDTYTMAAMWLENLQESYEKVNAMFGTNLSVEWRFPPEKKGSDIDNVGKYTGDLQS